MRREADRARSPHRPSRRPPRWRLAAALGLWIPLAAGAAGDGGAGPGAVCEPGSAPPAAAAPAPTEGARPPAGDVEVIPLNGRGYDYFGGREQQRQMEQIRRLRERRLREGAPPADGTRAPPVRGPGADASSRSR